MHRRDFLILLTAVLGRPLLAAAESLARPTRIDAWNLTHDRVWLGGAFWANPMEDWCVQDGWATCNTTGGNRSIHSLLYQITTPDKPFTLSVEAQRPEKTGTDGGGGFRIGIQSDINDHRANCFSNNGIKAGVHGDTLILGDATQKLPVAAPRHCEITLVGTPKGNQVELSLTVSAPNSGVPLGTLTATVPANQVLGNIALVSQFNGPNARPAAPGYRLRNWQISGDAFTHYPDRAFGPILWSMYSLSDNRSDEGFVMKLTAFTGPMGEHDNQNVELEVQRAGRWEKISSAPLATDAWTATFRIPNWDQKSATPYRLVYREKRTDGSEAPGTWTGTIRANPEGRPLRIGALTCQEQMGFPYKPVADNLVNLDLDLLYFSGDQLYEHNGGFGIIREPAGPAILNYLRKFYMFGWSFRESMRHAPTICLPDDHDVFHGNVWGEGGAPWNREVKGPSAGGYLQPAAMVNVVHKTNCSHHPDFASPRPCKQDISVYYGDMVYGGVGFAIIADRQWKSGPEHSGNTGRRVDHVTDLDADTAAFDKPGLALLGERQETFLKQWSEDWRAHSMKVVFSQTVFAGVATHHGGYNGYLKADLDSGAWPQTPRNLAIDLMRPAMPLHICGDQHLTSLVQYGVKEHRDSCWAFCTPAISVGYQRWWRPDEMGMPHEHRPSHNQPNTGAYIDGLGNKVYVYAIGNPVKDYRHGGGNRYDLAHRKNSGFGVVTVDTQAKTYTMDCYKFLVDATDGKPDNQFPGWPVTIHQAENKGENRLEA